MDPQCRAAQPLVHPRVGVFHILICSRIVQTWFLSLIKDKYFFLMTKNNKNLVRKKYPSLKRCQILETTCPTYSLTPISLLSWSLSIPLLAIISIPALLPWLFLEEEALYPQNCLILWSQEDPQLLWKCHSLLQNQWQQSWGLGWINFASNI